MTEEQAKQRFMILNLVRLVSIGIMAIGVAIIAGKIDVPEAVGYILLVVGLIDYFIMPVIMKRAWKKSDV